ncbi:hypothetical protein BCL64_1125 [Halomonas ventosae]|uniref:Uncharacterized protein n=1 Tax=Halomonas ventosae TaxID=229007 RepID=A0A2T0VKC6_9GAMM|nr:hypothetical protein BCL64_1125 [Halomonas ventosae]
MLKYRRLSEILPNNLIRMHCTTVTALFPNHHICEPRIRINKCSFYLFRHGRLHSVPMHDMGDLKASKTDFPDSSQLIANFV